MESETVFENKHFKIVRFARNNSHKDIVGYDIIIDKVCYSELTQVEAETLGRSLIQSSDSYHSVKVPGRVKTCGNTRAGIDCTGCPHVNLTTNDPPDSDLKNYEICCLLDDKK